ncbi:MAG: CpsD/CapB family tyrosine-protein kinase, partial [Cyanothece sp. SIO1E1]|nr:CpsD/CapB family tyrosine-protein kinase [Cyanothece sp. SIO1E1]
VIPFDETLAESASEVNITTFIQQASQSLGWANHSRSGSYPSAAFMESFRFLYANIRLLSSDQPIRSVVITSATAAEGKSTVSAHLAQAAAAMGQRVLLVDTDLRRPCLHEHLGMLNTRGLSTVISVDLDVNVVIQPSPAEDNLFVLTAGPVPPDSTRLLSSKRMQNLMAQLHEKFDLVIYDVPPLLGFADAYLLTAHTDGLILVAGLGKLKRSLIENALDELKVSGAPVLGVVANGSKDNTTAAHNYHQYRSEEDQNQPSLAMGADRSELVELAPAESLVTQSRQLAQNLFKSVSNRFNQEGSKGHLRFPSADLKSFATAETDDPEFMSDSFRAIDFFKNQQQ